MASWILQHLLYFFIQSGLDQVFIIERIRGDVYATGRPTHVYFLLYARSEILLPEAN